jgi:predicted dehydrogenase
MNTFTQLKTTNKKSLNLAYIGVGWIGRSRLNAIVNAGFGNPLAVIDTSPDAAKEILSDFPSAILNPSLEQLVEFSPDGVVIATPSALHAEQASLFLNHGVPVFCQKPLGRTLLETASVVEAAERKNVLLGVDFSYRSTMAYNQLLQLVQSGALGQIYAVNLKFHNAYGPDKAWFYDYNLSGGGCLIDLGIHLIDMTLNILNWPDITSVNSTIYAGGNKVRSKEKIVEDFVTAKLETDKETVINMECSWNISAGADAIIEAQFFGTLGGAAFKNINGSFYDFSAEYYQKTKKETLASPPDDWMGRSAAEWAEKLSNSKTFDSSALQFVKVAGVIDRIYGRF